MKNYSIHFLHFLKLSYINGLDWLNFYVYKPHIFLHCCFTIAANGSTVQKRCTCICAQFARSSGRADAPPVIAKFIDRFSIIQWLNANEKTLKYYSNMQFIVTLAQWRWWPITRRIIYLLEQATWLVKSGNRY